MTRGGSEMFGKLRSKKTLGVLVAATLALTTSVAGMGGQLASASAPTQVSFWNLFGGADGSTMQSIVNTFNKTHPSIHVTDTTLAWGDTYYSKVITSTLSGNPPDVAISHADHLLSLQNKGILTNVGSLAAQYGIKWSEFFKPPVTMSTIAGQHYAIPLDVHSFLLFYNKKLLKQAGVLPKNGQLDVKGYANFVKLLQTVQAKDKGIIPFDFTVSGWFPLALWYSFYEQMGGGNLLDSSNSNSVFMNGSNAEKSTTAMQDVSDLFNKYKVAPSNISNMEQVFQSNKAAVIIDGTWNVDAFHKALGNNLGVAAFPTLFNKPAVWADSHEFIIPNNPNRSKAELAATMTFIQWVEQHAYLWAAAGHIPANQTVQSTPQFKALPFRSSYGQQASFVHYFPATKSAWYMTFTPVVDPVQGILTKKLPISQGLQQLVQAFTDGAQGAQ